jgi:hypothetical protein
LRSFGARRLCDAHGYGFDPAMLSWPLGRRATDRVWAPHWYAAVEASTRLAPYDPRPADVPERLRWLADAARTTPNWPPTVYSGAARGPLGG